MVAGFVKDTRDIGLAFDQFRIAPFEAITAGIFSIQHEKNLVHQAGHGERPAGLINGRHIKDDIIVIARLEFREQLEQLHGGESAQSSFIPAGEGARVKEVLFALFEI